MVEYVPKERDIVYIDFSPIKGHEQEGIRPALVLSSKLFNEFTNMAIVCPITRNTKNFPTHYELKTTTKVKGAVLGEHVRSIDYNERHAKFVETLSVTEYNHIRDLFKSFFMEES